LLNRTRVSSRLLLPLEVALVVLIGLADFSIHEDVSVYVFYALPIILAAWYSGTSRGLFIAILSVLSWFAVDLKEQHYSYPLLVYWNALARGMFFVVISLLVSGLRAAYERERENAQRDFLTGLGNRRAFFERANVEKKRALRMHCPLVIAFIDIDQFKDVNDRFGHRTGDTVLKNVGDTLRRHTRETDVVARLGGDEFGIIVVESDQGGVAALKKIHDMLTQEMRKNNWNVTFSIGVCVYEIPPETVDEMVAGADRLMYAAKQSGKNVMKVEVFPYYPPREPGNSITLFSA
jgi:diguanylate cyclase (GGDEF)-like protein